MSPTHGIGPDEFRRHAHEVVDWIAEYLGHPEGWPVLPDVAPGDVAARLPGAPPAEGDDMRDILADFHSVILPGTTHWNHPGFMAYFANTGTAEGGLGEALAAALNVNAMLWRTGPAATELELRVLDW